MTPPVPRVSIGLPVFNGERFLPDALDSLLAQTFADFELIISDNSSTDRTSEICRSYAARDSRIRYFRNPVNIGVNPNWRRVFSYARGVYFKWSTHDDRYASQFLERCVAVLDRDPEVVVCYPRALVIDENSQPLRHLAYGLPTDLKRLENPVERIRALLWINLGAPPILGVIRADVLRKTPLIGASYAADQVLLAELALHGRFHELPEELLLHREHAHRSVYVHRTRHQLAAWVEPSNNRRIMFPAWQLMGHYLGAVRRAPLSPLQKLLCLPHLGRWSFYHWRELLGDIWLAFRGFPRSFERGKSARAS